ncbi:hypothetical protein wCauBTS_12860 [Wolbachia pipientis]
MNGKDSIVKLLLKREANVNAKGHKGFTPLHTAIVDGKTSIVNLLLADPNINVGCIKVASINKENKEEKEKFFQKFRQDYNLFEKVKKAANEKDTGKLDELLVEIEELLKSKNKHGFKPSLNYSIDGNDENTTIEIAINAGGKLLQLLYDYAKKDIDADTEIFKRLKHAKENSHSKSLFIIFSEAKQRKQERPFAG